MSKHEHYYDKVLEGKWVCQCGFIKDNLNFPAQKEEWGWLDELLPQEATHQKADWISVVTNTGTHCVLSMGEIEVLKERIRSQISQAEARGRETTITAFEEEIARLKKECTDAKPADEIEKVDERAYLAGLTDLLKFASSLKSNAPKV